MGLVSDVIQTISTRMSVFKKVDPVRDSSGFGHFLATRSAFIAQKTLYGYVKTRMGMKYPVMFQDEVFIESLNIGKWQVYAACLSDLAIYMAARIYGRTGDKDVAARVAAHWYGEIINDRFSVEEFTGDRAALIDEFNNRLALVDWNHATEPEGAFKESPKALVRWAPIDPSLKKLDAPLVMNSIRFQWQRVRSDLNSVFDVDAFLEDWNAGKS